MGNKKNAPTKSELETLKAQYKHLNAISVQDEDTEYTFVFKRPDRVILSAAMQGNGENAIDSAHTLAVNTLVWGDASLLDDALIFTAVAKHLNAMMNSVTSVLKKI